MALDATLSRWGIMTPRSCFGKEHNCYYITEGEEGSPVVLVHGKPILVSYLFQHLETCSCWLLLRALCGIEWPRGTGFPRTCPARCLAP
jgi:hypothetical protein